MKGYFEKLSENPKIKAYFEGVVGLTIKEACNYLNYWWVHTGCHVCSNGRGTYTFERSAGGWIELHTTNNVVTSERHNGYAMVYALRDINNKNL